MTSSNQFDIPTVLRRDRKPAPFPGERATRDDIYAFFLMVVLLAFLFAIFNIMHNFHPVSTAPAPEAEIKMPNGKTVSLADFCFDWKASHPGHPLEGDIAANCE